MFIVTWFFDKLGYVPKLDLEVNTINLDVKPPDFKMWPFPVVEVTSLSEETKKPAVKKPTVKKATTRKPKAK